MAIILQRRNAGDNFGERNLWSTRQGRVLSPAGPTPVRSSASDETFRTTLFLKLRKGVESAMAKYLISHLNCVFLFRCVVFHVLPVGSLLQIAIIAVWHMRWQQSRSGETTSHYEYCRRDE